MIPRANPETFVHRISFRLPGLLAVFLLLGFASRCAGLTLISRSAGLELPQKEEGYTELEVGDVNGDGNLDVVSVGDHGDPGFNSDEHGIMVWLGNGAGTWDMHQTGDFGYGGCAIGDLDLDGRMDLAWGIHHNYGSGMGSRLISAARGDGTGVAWTDWGQGLATNGETWGMFATALADYDGDGRLDILSESFGGDNGLQLYRNLGDGTWSPAWAAAGGTVQYTVESCDFNADGYADIVCTRSGTNAFLGDGAFHFTVATTGLPSGTIRCIDAGDMDGDGRDDIVFGPGASGLRCCRFDPGSSTWQSVSAGLPTTGTFNMCQFGDIDGDGHLDIVGYDDPTGTVYLGDGAGHWAPDATWTMPSPGDFSALRVDGDLDHDGREDILVQATQSGFPFNRNQLRAYSAWVPPAALSGRVVAPGGGETLRIGSIRDIRWLAAVPALLGQATVTIRISLSGPAGPWRTLAAALPDNGRFQWRVAAEGSSPHCRLQLVIRAGQDSVVAVSPRDFRIAFAEGAAVPDPRLPNAADPASDRTVIAPNPAEDEVVVQSPSHALDLFDASGRLMRHWVAASDRFRMPLIDQFGRPLPRGVYLLRASAAGRSAVVHLVKR